MAIGLVISLNAQISFTTNSSVLSGSYGYPGCVVDMNGDDLDDVVRMNGSQLTIDYQQANGTFVHQNYLNTNSSGLWSICAGDIDANGYNDLCLGDGSHVEFLFADATGSSYTSDFHTDYIFSQRSTMADIDADGNLDAFVCHDVDQSHPYRNDGNGNVTEDQSLIVTAPVGGNYAAIWCDYDNDSDIDLYITKCRGGAPAGDPQRINGLYRNDGGTYTEVGAATGMNDGAQSWSTVFEDFDNDGDFDAFIVNHSDGNRFMENDGSGNFNNIIASTGIDEFDLGAWESQSADFDNDGFVDIISEVGAGIYRNNGNMTFTDISVQVSDGGIGDLNNDGWLDVQNGGTIYYNDGGTNHWVKFTLDGILSNANGIGSRVELFGSWGMQTREVRSGQGFAHMNAIYAHFGIGSETSIDSVRVTWPSGIVTVIDNPAIDQMHIVPEASCILAPGSITASGSTDLCPGQTVDLTADPGYTSYLWSNGETTQTITVDEAGQYSVVASDANDCVSLSNPLAITIVQDETPQVSLSGDDTFCEGEQITLTSSTAAGYLWSTGETTQSIDVDQDGSYYVTITGICSDVDSDPVVITVNPAATDPVAPNVAIPGPGVATLTATGDNILWYDDEVAITEVGSGNSWDTPFLNNDAQYWCEANAIYGGALESGGKPDNMGGGGLPGSGAWSYFDAWEPFTIQTVRVYPPSDGLRTIQLADENDAILATVDTFLTAGEHVVTLNFDVPVGNDFSLRCPQNNMFRNNSGVQYPYAIGTVGELTDSYYGQNYYYYFYDWTIMKEQMICPSDRVAVDVFVTSTGIEDLGSVSGLSVHPNPASNEVYVSFELLENSEIDVEVFDAIGKLVYSATRIQTSLGMNDHTIDVSDLNTGLYSVKFNVNGKTVTRNLIVE